MSCRDVFCPPPQILGVFVPSCLRVEIQAVVIIVLSNLIREILPEP